MDDGWTGLWEDAVGLVLHEARWALAAWHTGLKAVGLQHPQRNGVVEAGLGAGGATLVKDVAPLLGAAHRCGGREREAGD